MTPQEAELLKYLEDLQANNPAEYDMLVSQLQANGGANGAPAGGVKVVPEPGFVAKTRSFTRKGTKVFINICHSEHVDPPGAVEPAPSSSGDELPLRIPLSLGPPREDLDKEGDVCTCYDVVFHPSTVESSLGDEDFRNLMLQLTLHQIKQKHGDDLSDNLSFPKIKGNYKGIAPLPQFMRKRGALPTPQGGDDAAQAKAGSVGEASLAPRKPLVEELDSGTDDRHLLPAPAYAVEPCKWRDGVAERVGEDEGKSGNGGDESAGVNCLSVKLHLPEVEDAQDVEVELTSDELRLFVPSKYRVAVLLPQPVELRPLCARFETSRRILNVALRCVIENNRNIDGNSNAPSETEEERRAREARLRAKRRLARAKAEKEAAQAAAEQAAKIDANANEGAVPAAAEEALAAASEHVTRVADPESTDASSRDAAPGGERDGGKSSTLPAPLILTNSLAMELED